VMEGDHDAAGCAGVSKGENKTGISIPLRISSKGILQNYNYNPEPATEQKRNNITIPS